MKINIIVLLCFASLPLFAQNNNQAWKGKKCAIVLTYDDAIQQHLDNAAPVLDSLNLKATFYLTVNSDACKNRVESWKKLARNGHELGNHTLYHPCVGGEGRSWVRPEYDLRNYTVKRIEDEIRLTNNFLKLIDGKNQRTFAFTCGDMRVGDSSFIDGLKHDFVAARAVRHQMHSIDSIDLYNVDCYVVNNHSFEEMKAWVDEAIQSNKLLVILFHGVGGGNALDVSVENHRKILAYIKSKEQEVWVDTMIHIANYVKRWQRNKTKTKK